MVTKTHITFFFLKIIIKKLRCYLNPHNRLSLLETLMPLFFMPSVLKNNYAGGSSVIICKEPASLHTRMSLPTVSRCVLTYRILLHCSLYALTWRH